jgi:replicative DNA helicase
MSGGRDSSRTTGNGNRRTRRDGAESIFERRPPCNLDAEAGVLGSILIKPDVCDDVALFLRAEDFYDDAHRKLFEHLLRMHDAGRKIDETLLLEQLTASGDLELVGGLANLARIVQTTPTAAHAVYYAEIVRDKSTYRSLIDSATDILKDAYDETHAAREALSHAEQKIFSILDNRGVSNVADIRAILHEAMDRLDARMRGEHTAGGVETGFTDLDKLTSGLHNGELVVLAARPSMGKTALALNIAENVALRQQIATLFVSLEMSAIELADRLLCSFANVNGHRLRSGSLSQGDRLRLVEKAAELSQAPLYVDDSPSRTVTEIAAAARRIRRRQKRLGLIVIDYLQLIEPDDLDDPRQEQVAKMTRRLKGLAREMKVPVLCLAQLNRQAEASKDNRPRLSHLRESGAIEQDADVVMFVHRESYYLRGEEREQREAEAEIIVAKQRNGPVDDVPVVWRKEFTRFEDKAPDRLQEFDDYNAQVAGFE